MPVDYSKYHPKWNLISRLVRFRRAGNCCEQCGVANYVVGYRDKNGEWCAPQYGTLPDGGFADARQARAWCKKYNSEIGGWYEWETKKVWFIVLTVAHLDHNVGNNRFGNLAALCQRCHLVYDRPDNADKRRYGPTGRHHNQIRLEL